MSASRKLYNSIASTVADLIRPETERTLDYLIGVHDVVSRIADELQADNPSFDRSRFLAACDCSISPYPPVKHSIGRRLTHVRTHELGVVVDYEQTELGWITIIALDHGRLGRYHVEEVDYYWTTAVL